MQSADLSIGCFQFGSVDTMLVPVQDKWFPHKQLPGSVYEYSDPAELCFMNPGCQFCICPVPVNALKQHILELKSMAESIDEEYSDLSDE